MASVELMQITKIFDNKVKAVDDVSLQIQDKEFVVLVGPSGCGKSTLLRMIAGLEEITKGEILIDGHVINNVLPKDRDIAMVFQNYALYPHMTVYDNMAFGLKLRKMSKAEIKKRVYEAAEILEIEDYLDRKPKALSGGQRQRVAVGRAIVRQPKVFLFDEPLSNLDAKLRVQMRIEINRIYHRLKTTMVYVTHDQIEAMTMGNKIVVLKDGVIQQIDSPLELYHNPTNTFVAGFIGSPSMNFFTGKIERNGKAAFKSGVVNFELTEKLAGQLQTYPSDKNIILGIRPENFTLLNKSKTGTISNPQSFIIDVAEPVGNEVFVYFCHDQQSYCMRMPPTSAYHPGKKIDVAINLENVYFFDSETGERIA